MNDEYEDTLDNLEDKAPNDADHWYLNQGRWPSFDEWKKTILHPFLYPYSIGKGILKPVSPAQVGSLFPNYSSNCLLDGLDSIRGTQYTGSQELLESLLSTSLVIAAPETAVERCTALSLEEEQDEQRQTSRLERIQHLKYIYNKTLLASCDIIGWPIRNALYKKHPHRTNRKSKDHYQSISSRIEQTLREYDASKLADPIMRRLTGQKYDNVTHLQSIVRFKEGTSFKDTYLLPTLYGELLVRQRAQILPNSSASNVISALERQLQDSETQLLFGRKEEFEAIDDALIISGDDFARRTGHDTCMYLPSKPLSEYILEDHS